MRLSSRALSLVGAFVFSFGSCVVSHAGAAELSRPLKIYVPGSYTGIMPFLADGILTAIKGFAEKTNAEGGLLGRPLEVVAQDDKADVELAARNAKVALSDPDHLVTVGHSFSSIAYPIGKMYSKASKLFFTPYATSTEVSKVNGTTFQLCFNDHLQSQVLATVALKRLKAKRILVLTNRSDPYSDGLSTEFLKSAKESKTATGVEFFQYDYLADKLNVLDLVNKVRETNPDLIFLPELKVHAAEIVRNLHTQGLGSLQLLGSDGWGSEEGTLDMFFSGAKQSLAGHYFYTYHWHPDIKTKRNRELKQLIHKQTGKIPYGPGVLAFEAVEHLARIVQQANTFDNALIGKKLRGSSYVGSTGKVIFDSDGSTKRNLVLIELSPNGLKYDSLVAPQ